MKVAKPNPVKIVKNYIKEDFAKVLERTLFLFVIVIFTFWLIGDLIPGINESLYLANNATRFVILASVIGALLGCFTGLVPGIHANTIAILLYSTTIIIEEIIESKLTFISDSIDVKVLIVIAIASTSISHTFLNFIPGTVIGAPEESTAMGVLPMHEMVMRKDIYSCKNGHNYYPKKNPGEKGEDLVLITPAIEKHYQSKEEKSNYYHINEEWESISSSYDKLKKKALKCSCGRIHYPENYELWESEEKKKTEEKQEKEKNDWIKNAQKEFGLNEEDATNSYKRKEKKGDIIKLKPREYSCPNKKCREKRSLFITLEVPWYCSDCLKEGNNIDDARTIETKPTESAPGYYAIYYSAVGSLYAAIFCIFLILPLKFLIGEDLCNNFPELCGDEQRGYEVVTNYMLYILLSITILLIFTDRARLKKYIFRLENNRINFYGFKRSQIERRVPEGAVFVEKENLGMAGRIIGIGAVLSVFVLAGFLGWIVLNEIEGTADSPFNPYLREKYGFYLPGTALFPAFTGLFGIATLLFSLETNPTYTNQELGQRRSRYTGIDVKEIGETIKKNTEELYDRFNLSDGRKLKPEIKLISLFNPRLWYWFIFYKLKYLILRWYELFNIWKVPKYQCPECSVYYEENDIWECGDCKKIYRQEHFDKQKCECETKLYPKIRYYPKCKCSADKIESVHYKNSLIGASAGSVAGLLPGVTAGIGTIMAMTLRNAVGRFIMLQDKNEEDMYENDYHGRSEEVIMTLSAVNTAASLTILAGLFIILKARNGTTIVINQMIDIGDGWVDTISMPQVLTYLLICILISIVIGYVFTATIGRSTIELLINAKAGDNDFTRKAIWTMLIGLTILVWIFSGIVGVAVLIVSTLIGILAPIMGVRKSHAMGFLLIPVMIFYYNMSGSGLFS